MPDPSAWPKMPPVRVAAVIVAGTALVLRPILLAEPAERWRRGGMKPPWSVVVRARKPVTTIEIVIEPAVKKERISIPESDVDSWRRKPDHIRVVTCRR